MIFSSGSLILSSAMYSLLLSPINKFFTYNTALFVPSIYTGSFSWFPSSLLKSLFCLCMSSSSSTKSCNMLILILKSLSDNTNYLHIFGSTMLTVPALTMGHVFLILHRSYNYLLYARQCIEKNNKISSFVNGGVAFFG